MALTESIYSSSDELNQAFAKKILALLSQGIEQNGRASLAVSGGRTPVALFKTLSANEFAWDKVDITLADERWVEPTDDASNEKLVKTHLLVDKAASANFVPLKTSHSNASDAVVACTDAYLSMQNPLDVLILGMGEDGHTASIFPCSAEVNAGLDLTTDATFIAVQPTTAPHQRMSFTLKALLQSKKTFLHLTGDSKKQVLQNAIDGSDETEMPIRAVLSGTDVELVWAP